MPRQNPQPRATVFGSTGFIGSAVTEALRRRGYSVKRAPSPRIQGHSRITPEEIFSAFSAEIAACARECLNTDVVVNCAGNPDASLRNTHLLFGANAATAGIIAAAANQAGVHRLIHVSSAVVQGRRQTLDSTQETDPFSPYSISKILGESLVSELGPAGTTIYRPPSVHAPQRRVTRTLTRLARSPFNFVASPGTANSPQTLVENVADAIATIASYAGDTPPIVHHPSEGITTASLLYLLGSRQPRRIPIPIAKAFILIAMNSARIVPRLEANARRIEMVMNGQKQALSWLDEIGWKPVAGLDQWRSIGVAARTSQNPELPLRISFGITTGLCARTFYEGQFSYLSKYGFNVELIATNEGDAATFAMSEGAQFYDIKTSRHPSPFADAAAFARLFLHLARTRPDITIWGTPKVAFMGVILSRLLQIPSIYVVHGLRYQTMQGWKRKALVLCETASCKFSTATVSVSQSVREAIIADLNVAPETIRVLGSGSANGVVLACSDLWPPRHLEGQTRFGFVGRLARDKGLTILARAWDLHVQQHPDDTLHIFGNGDDLDSLGFDSVQNVEPHGFVSDPDDIYKHIDVLVLPSYREGMPTVVLEAATRGIPTIGARATGTVDLVEHEVTGWLVAPRSVEQLSEALDYVSEHPDQQGKLGQSARTYVNQRFERTAVHAQWLLMIREVLNH